MTNKDAIKILSQLKYPYPEYYKDIEVNEALDIAIEALEEKPQGDCKSCRHRDPEDKRCDCGAKERQGCPFPVSDDYFCKFYEKGGAE